MKSVAPTETRSPDLIWLIGRLAALNPSGAKDRPGVVEHHAYEVRGRWLAWRRRDDNKRYTMINGRWPRAVLVNARRGPANELKRLLRAAKGKSDKRWRTAWLSVSGTTRNLIFRVEPPPIAIGPSGERRRGDLDMSNLEIAAVRGLHMLMPRRSDAVPLIEAALAKLEAIPAAERRKRERDTLADDVVRAVCVAYSDLTGEAGITWSAAAEKYEGGLLDFAHAIEARFGSSPFSIDRLRKNIFKPPED